MGTTTATRLDAAPVSQGQPRYLDAALAYPHFRLMGSKHRLLPWLSEVFSSLTFESALDAFSGSGCVSYLLKAMGKTVVTNDFLRFAFHLANALTANPGVRLDARDVELLLRRAPNNAGFIERTFSGIFFAPADLRFLDNTWANLEKMNNPWKRSLAIAAMCRAAVKKQPRGVFTVRKKQSRQYDDGRRDTRLTLQEHFLESVGLFADLAYDDGHAHLALCGDVFDAPTGADLVYLDPPYVPRSDDNCYIKRYHFLEGLSCYWEGLDILQTSQVKKLKKRFTPFSYRRTSIEAFDRLFTRFRASILVLSYSSNGYPDKDDLVRLMQRHKRRVRVEERNHRYHFGTHSRVNRDRADVREYLIIGQ